MMNLVPNKIFYSVLSLILMSIFLVGCHMFTTESFEPRIYHCMKTAKPIPEDNFFKSTDWETAEKLNVFYRLPEKKCEWTQSCPHAEEQTEVKIMWDNDFLYLTAQLYGHECYAKPDAPTWESDVLELFIKPSTNSKEYYEFHVTCDSRIWSARFSGSMGKGKQIFESGLQCKVETLSPGNWRVYLRLPLKVLVEQPPKPGDEWRFNIARQNYGKQFKYDAKLRGNAIRGIESSCSAAHVVGKWAFHDCGHFDILKFK